MKPYYEEDGITIYHADCRDVLPAIRTDSNTAVVTDPPYGIEGHVRTQPGAHQFSAISGDDNTDMAAALFEWLPLDIEAVVFGANNFPELLPHKGRWLCWDKRLTTAADKMLGSPFELAWMNRRSGFHKMVRCLHGGVVNANGRHRYHPTEKPIPMLRTVIADLAAGVIIDPFMGSGTTLRAAKDLGRKAIGIEIEERYCEIAVQRLAQGVLAFG